MRKFNTAGPIRPARDYHIPPLDRFDLPEVLELDSDQVAFQLSARQRAIVAACDVPRSMAELMERAGVSHRSHFRQKHLKPLLEAGLVRMTNPGNPRAPNQRYVLTDAGVAVKGSG